MVLDRYIGKSVLSGTLLASFVMLSIFAFVDFVNQLNYVGTGNYGALQAAIFVFMRLPQRMYELSPSILLLGGILSMGGLAANSELIVMRASGISAMRITRSVLQTGLLIAMLVALLGEFVVPDATRGAKTFRAELIEKKLIVGGMNDIWARDGNRYVNVKRILPDHQLRGVTVYELNEEHQLNRVTYASSAQYKDDRWELRGIKRSDISFDGVTTFEQQQLNMERLILLELFSVLELESKDMSAFELLTYSDYLRENKLDSDEYLLAFWIKVFTPLTCLAMLMIAMPLVFATTPRSGGVGQRIMIAILIGVIYFVVNRSINHLGLALDAPPLLSASLPLILVSIVSIFFLRRVH